jgi:hypothetical protein
MGEKENGVRTVSPSLPYSTHFHNLPQTFPSSNIEPLASADPDKSCPDPDFDSSSNNDPDNSNNSEDGNDSNNSTNNNNNRQAGPQIPPSNLPASMVIDASGQPVTLARSYSLRSLQSLPRPPSSLLPATIPPHRFYGSKTFDYIAHLEKKADFYRTHCTMLEMENQNLKRKINQQDNAWSSKKHKVVTDAQMLTSDEGLRLAEEQEEEQCAKKQKKKETAQRREDKAAEWQ